MSRFHSTLEPRNDINYSDKMIGERALLLHKIFTTSTINPRKGE
jgi:hypothetical protein